MYTLISIHALLAESDCKTCRKSSLRQNFYPRSPCGERPLPSGLQCGSTYFYPRSPCGERRGDMVFQISINDFYPRSPCGERRERRKGYHPPLQFLSTLSLRRATGARLAEKISKCISIHALLAESDVMVIKQGEYMGISIHALLAESDSSTTYIV